jgi:hypothetical protein
MTKTALPFAITLDSGTSLANQTGTWRSSRPEYVDRLPPCNNACPAGENIQKWLYHAEEGDYATAWQALVEDNPLPAVMGRVCYHPCEDACNRGQLDEPVSVHAVERFLGDFAIERGLTPTYEAVPSGKKVLVIGAGPSGLSAAYHLPSRPGEFHPEPLTDPDVILSHHPAPAITRRLPPSAEQ